MADRTVEVIYGLTGQTVELYPPEWVEGIPSSASASVFDGYRSNDDTADLTPSVTVDSTSITITTASGYSQSNRRRLYSTSTTGATIGRHVITENALGQRELVTPSAISSNTYVDVESDLAYDYPVTTSFVKGIRMTWTVDSTWVATESNILTPEMPSYRVLWAYTVNSIARRHYTYLRLVRQYAKHGVTVEHLKEYWPDIQFEEFVATRGQQMAHAIDAAWDRFRVDLLNAGYKPEQIRDTETIDEIVRAGTFKVLARMGVSPPGRDAELWVQEATKDYEDLFMKAIGALKIALDVGSEGGIASSPLRQLFFQR